MQGAGVAAMKDLAYDCCVDGSTASKHGNPCKPGQECKTVSILQMAYVKPGSILVSPITALFTSDVLPEPTPSGVWRPPSQLIPATR